MGYYSGMNENDAAKELIGKNLYAVIATAEKDGKPWVSPVFFAHDDAYRMYWVSNREARHSCLIRENPNVAIVIFDSSVPEGDPRADALYLKAIAEELSLPIDIEKGIEVYNAKATKDEFRIADATKVIGDNLWRIYRATFTEVTKLGKSELVNGQHIDMRIPIHL